MPMLPKLSRTLAATCMALSLAPASAQDLLSATEVRALIVGNTVEVQRPNGTRYLAFYEPGGLWVRQERGRIVEGTWRILDDGMQCVAVGKDDACARIQKNADGTYTRIQEGQPQFTWLKIASGKAL
jgi:hypothetical protein